MANFTIPFVTVLQPVNYDRFSGDPGYSSCVRVSIGSASVQLLHVL